MSRGLGSKGAAPETTAGRGETAACFCRTGGTRTSRRVKGGMLHFQVQHLSCHSQPMPSHLRLGFPSPCPHCIVRNGDSQGRHSVLPSLLQHRLAVHCPGLGCTSLLRSNLNSQFHPPLSPGRDTLIQSWLGVSVQPGTEGRRSSWAWRGASKHHPLPRRPTPSSISDLSHF